MEQILNDIQSTLDRDAATFLKEARRVAAYDAALRDSQKSLSTLTNQIHMLMMKQSDVDQTLRQGIASRQDELNHALDVLEGMVDDLFEGQSHLIPEDADVERERAYATAVELDGKLHTMSLQLEHLKRDLDAAEERSASTAAMMTTNGAGGGELGRILGILNAHHEAMAHLEWRGREIEGDLASIGRALASSSSVGGN